ncbi:carboxy terminal-processing peptidase [Synoicihabitans lomoniglobus]|uniref:Carboxy terminal-processing peptidase n=1 Tax=Synoicihabitans lomoniglobus TaxID=2909285 RepID=A0AAF0I237_9BACT|nr:carboxy terminal-processing peptidase [Opitutaceae bacterium LMO-M01]WED66237.1 carboxy terminal-processing peptidase [Opitutaceae bacterium LMO-M01]
MIVLPRRFVALLTASLIALSSGMLEARPDRTFTLTRSESKEISNFIRLLEEAHYNREAVTAASYPPIVTTFMEDWDAQHLFFLKSDADSFNTQFGEELYWNVRTLGNIDPAFQMFQRYEDRVEARTAWVFRRLQGEFDTGTSEQFKVDRSEVNWLANESEADAVWEKRLLFEIEQELLNDRDIDEAKERVRKRYERRLKNLADIETHEITELFLTNIAQLYDPHSTYFSAETFEDFSIQMRLQLVGIGALLGMEEDECVIKEIIAGGPADLDKRLKPNDKIIAVSQDGSEPIELIGMKLRKIVDKIRGERGTPVHLTIQPADAVDASERKEIILTRDVVNLDSARARGAIFEVPDTKGHTKSVGVISLPTFYGPDPSNTDGAQNSATADIAELISQMQETGIDGLVLDLRDNGGGLLSEAIDLTGLFIEQGPVVQVRSYYGDIKVDEDQDSSVRYAGPLAVLVSKFSASASEIVAGALQNYGRAVVLGDSSTHGKGTVQTVYEMRNLDRRMLMTGEKSGAAKFTIQKFYLPSGSSTQLNGVVPDIVLPSIEDVMESGERFLPQALVWDEIQTTEFNGAPLDAHILSPLREASLARRESLEEFKFLQANIDWFTARQEEKFISLNLDQRIERRDADKAFREQMDERRKRLREENFAFTEFLLTPPEDQSPDPVEVADEKIETATELPAPATTALADAETSADADDMDGEVLSTDEEPEPEGYARLDVHLREALRVIVDAVEIGNNPVYADHAPLTARPSSGG